MNISNATTLNTLYNYITENDNTGELYIKLYPVSFLSGGPSTTTDSTGTYIKITESDILPGTFSIDRYTQSGEAFEIGTAYAAECKFSLENYDGRYNNVLFEGAEIQAFLTISGNSYQIGKFTVDEKPRKLTNIAVTALDDMVKLDRECSDITAYVGMKIHNAIMSVCTTCGVSYNSSDITSSIPTTLRSYNLTANMEQESNETITYRQVLMWLLQLACMNAYITVDGKLKTRFYGNEHSSFNSKFWTIDSDVRISAESLDERSYGVFSLTTGSVTVTKGGNTEPFTSGNTEYCLELDLSDNPFVCFLETEYTSNTTLLQYIFTQRFGSFAYRPFKAKTLSLFWLEPLDYVSYKVDSTSYASYISHIVFKYDGFMEFEIKSESKTKSGYATANPLTAYEREILKTIRDSEDSTSERELSIIEFNKAINAGSALHSTTYNGKTYYHDKENLLSSDYIMTFNSAGVAWTDEGWKSSLALDSAVWKYGFSCNGNTILNSIDTYKLNAELITVNDLIAFGATIGGWHINTNELYSDYGRYRAFIQNAAASGENTWVFSTQYDTTGNGDYNGRFYVTTKGELYAQNIKSETYLEAGSYVKTGQQVDDFDSVVHSRYINSTEYIGKFGVGTLSSKGTVALELRNENYTVARLDVLQDANSDGAITLKASRKDPNEFNRYVTFDSLGVFFHKSYKALDSTAMDDVYCGNIILKSGDTFYNLKNMLNRIFNELGITLTLNSASEEEIIITDDEESDSTSDDGGET